MFYFLEGRRQILEVLHGQDSLLKIKVTNRSLNRNIDAEIAYVPKNFDMKKINHVKFRSQN